jgi:ABC-type Fe3+-hydroxamate transport system substrate-binding protein
LGCEDKGRALAATLEEGLDRIRTAARTFPSRPRVFFEEWDPSTYILQPGPASLTDGVRMIHERLASMYAD